MRITLTLLCVATALCGCVAPHSQPEHGDYVDLDIVSAYRPSNTDIINRFKFVAGAYRDICLDPAYEKYFEKTPCLPQLATRRQLRDRTRITPAQAQVMQKALREIDELNLGTQTMMIDSGIEPHVGNATRAMLEFDPQTKANQQMLLNGFITWGEYTRRRMELSREHQEALQR